MAEPNTGNKGLIIPATGDLPGAWGTAAMNPNFSALDGLLGGFATLAFSSATTITLSVSSAVTLTPGAGPFQSQNSLLYFTGSLTGNVVIQFQMPGFYIVHNQCTVGSFYVQLAPSSGGGNTIGAIPGRKCHVFFDGTNMDYVNLPDPGTAYDLHGVTTYPGWMTACTIAPYLLKDGSTYSTVTYPALGALLGSTFGGNGVTTFGVPDERARVRIALDTNTNGGVTNRLTAAISGVTGTTMASAGGSQAMQSHTHTAADSGHTHQEQTLQQAGSGANQVSVAVGSGTDLVNTVTAVGTAVITVTTTGSGTSQNLQPSIISFLPLIKT